MIPLSFLLALPLVAGQFESIGVQPDVAFGDQNDRYDLSGMLEGQQKYFDTHGMADTRRYRDRPNIPPRRRLPPRAYRRDDDWLDDVRVLGDNRYQNDNDQRNDMSNADMIVRAQEYRRHPQEPEIVVKNDADDNIDNKNEIQIQYPSVIDQLKTALRGGLFGKKTFYTKPNKPNIPISKKTAVHAKPKTVPIKPKIAIPKPVITRPAIAKPDVIKLRASPPPIIRTTTTTSTTTTTTKPELSQNLGENEKEILLQYSLPIKIKVLETPKGQFIKEIKIL